MIQPTNPTKPYLLAFLGVASLLIIVGVAGLQLNQRASLFLEPSNPPDQSRDSAIIPEPADWTDYGMVIDAAPFGAGWDALFEGYTPASLVKKGDTYYLYYVGADDYISQKDNIGPAHRSIGVATSTDGIHWAKHAGNPVITFSSSGNPEEGAVSAGVFVDATGTFYAYYGANVAETPTTPQVNADVRLATSPDGLSFTDQGVVLRHSERTVWGSGDELHPIMAWEQDEVWYSYYLPNGTAQGGKLGLARGPAPGALTSSSAVFSGGTEVAARGPSSVVPVAADTLAFFLNNRGALEVRTASVDDLQHLSAPVQSYGQQGGSSMVYLDSARRTWFMIYDRWSYMGLRLAPAGPPDTSPPSAPPSLVAKPLSAEAIELTWGNATDPDTGVVLYNVYREGAFIASTMRTLYVDGAGLAELAGYSYEVRAVNFHGTEGPPIAISVVTLPDREAPQIDSVDVAGENQLRVTFSEPVEKLSAETPSNYAISDGVAVVVATLDTDARTIHLTSTDQIPGVAYTLTASDVLDLAQTPNRSSATAAYAYGSIPGLVGYWSFDDSSSAVARDGSGHRSHGAIKGNPTRTVSRAGAAINLNGTDDYVEIDSPTELQATLSTSFSLSLWARPSGIPPNTTNSDGAYTMIAGPNLLIQYDHEQGMAVQTSTVGGDVRLSAGAFPPDNWYHLVMVVDDNARLLHLYVNGNPVSGSPKPYDGELVQLPLPVVGVMDEYRSRYRIGVNSPLFDFSKNYFRGAIDEVRLYSRALGPNEVEWLSRLEP